MTVRESAVFATGGNCSTSRSKPVTEMLSCPNAQCGDETRWRSSVCRHRYLALHLREHNVLGSAGVLVRDFHICSPIAFSVLSSHGCSHLLNYRTCVSPVEILYHGKVIER